MKIEVDLGTVLEAQVEYEGKDRWCVVQTLNGLASDMWLIAKSKGFHDKPLNVGEVCANIHAEVSELFEAHRNGKLDCLCDKQDKMDELGLGCLTCRQEELADILIRVLGVAHEWGIDLDRAVYLKSEYNRTRTRMNGGKLV